MKIKKLKIILASVSIILAAALTVSVIFIFDLSGDKIKNKKVTKRTRLEYVDGNLYDYIDDTINDIVKNPEIKTDDNSDNTAESSNTDTEETDNETTDDLDWLEKNDDDKDDKIYKSDIQANGTAVAGNDRTIDIATDKTVFSDFQGIGGCLFPELLSNEPVSGWYNSVAWEFERQKIVNAKPGFVRLPIDMDAIITNTEESPYRLDYTNNKDYINYTKGIYSFSNDSADSFWETVDCLNDSGTAILLNSGWKGTDRTKVWYPDVTNDFLSSAPYDINAFIRANIAWLLEAQHRGYKIKYIDFGNEVSWGGDFKAQVGTLKYYTVLITAAVKAIEYAKNNPVTYRYIDKDGSIKEQTLILDSELELLMADSVLYTKGVEWMTKLKDNLEITLGDKSPAATSVHAYYKGKTEETDPYRSSAGYNAHYYTLNRTREVLGKQLFITEFFASPAACDADYNSLTKEHTQNVPGDWDTSYCGYFISSANSGVKGLANWEYGTGYYPCTAVLKNSSYADGAGSLFGVGNKETEYRVSANYRLVSLLSNYITVNSSVLMSKWTGDDIRVSSFKLADGNYTFVVEAKKTGVGRNISINLDKSIGKLYRYCFRDTLSDAENRTLQGILVQSDKAFNSASSISDEIDGEYGVYVYSTKAPAEQIKLDKAVTTIESGNTLEINAELLNCANHSNIKWSIAAASKNAGKNLDDKNLMGDDSRRGSISSNGNKCIYTPGSSAQKGDSIAIRADLLDAYGNTTGVYSISVIYIK